MQVGSRRSFLSVADLSKQEFADLLERTRTLKESIARRSSGNILEKKVIGLLFEKPSTRTRTSFEVAAFRLGGEPIYMQSSELQGTRGEPIQDTARILGSYLDCIVARVFAHDTVIQLAKHSHVSVVNALSDLEHPTQIISDFLTIIESKGKLQGLTLAYIGDGDNVCNSLLLGSALVGMNMNVACPEGYDPDAAILAKAQSLAKETGVKLTITRKPTDAVKGADVLYTDVWVSMGEDAERDKRIKAFQGYQINSTLLKAANPGAVVMHCLPAHRGLEITDDVIEGAQSIVWQQGANKLYSAASVLEYCLK
ncbi:MAG TPA: ornithine carbamoyltransferase [Candidatus Acidoferrum sp.]|nr:ornithine carbamoyltransferase [Candidatus Acidoferrum sp.]